MNRQASFAERFKGKLRTSDYETLLHDFREARKDKAALSVEAASKDSKLFDLMTEQGGFGWWQWYELPFIHHAALACVLFGWSERLKAFGRSANPPRDFMDFARSADSELDPDNVWPDDKKAACFDLVIGMGYSMEAVGFYSLPINDLLEKARTGDRRRLIEAMTIDRCALLTSTGSQILARAQLSNDRRFLNSVFKRMKEPRKRLRTYVDLRLITKALMEVGDFASSSASEIESLVSELNIAAPKGAKEIRDQMRRFKVKSTT